MGEGCGVLAGGVGGQQCWWTAVLVYSAVAVDSISADLVAFLARWGLTARSPYWRIVHINAAVDHG